MACSSRSLIASGLAVAAVIAWRLDAVSGRTQTAESPEEAAAAAALRNPPTFTESTKYPLWE